MAAIAIPLIEPAIIAIAAGAAVLLAAAIELPSKMKQWVTDNADRVESDLKKKEMREPTPYTAPSLFDSASISSRKVFIKKNSEEVWDTDTCHWNHFEVYLSRKTFEKGNRNRAVWIDGRLKQWF
eukprot:TRINITY_DN1484_c0_g1_i1.p1 TRINITY_DN1484_c0_g1~~TRINITY_DN1484_c0_g1_i1.p1  ORF type:complete len:125 (-),score=43.80 TRINITY_DN1484_c0_g1_i1:97-471(-)